MQCFVFDGEPETLDAMEACDSEWIAAISPRAMWGKADWYPQILEMLGTKFGILVPVTNEPAPDWQAAGPEDVEMLEHRAIAKECCGGILDVSDELEHATDAAVIVRKRDARAILRDGLASAHEHAGSVGLMQSIYVVRCA